MCAETAAAAGGDIDESASTALVIATEQL